MQLQKIEFRKEREFTTVFSDAIKFLKQNFKSLFSAIIVIIGPLILLSGLAYSYMQTLMMSNTMSGLSGLGMFNQTYFVVLGVSYLLMLINSVLLNSVVFNYMCLYQEKEAGEKISVSEVASRVWSNIGRVLGSLAMLLMLLIAVSIVFGLIGLGFVSMGVVGGVLIALGIIFGAMIYFPIFTYYLSAGFFVVVRDRQMILSSFGKVRSYLSGNFWWTWLILVVALIVLSIVQMVFNLPAAILTMMETFTRMREVGSGRGTGIAGETSIWLIIFYTIGRFLTTCSYAVLHLVCGFNFLSQEEKHEGKGIMSRIEEIK